MLASGGYDKSIRLWDVSTGEMTRELKGHPGSVHCLAALPNNMLASGDSWDNSIRLWDVLTGEMTGELKGHTSSVR